MGPPPWGLFTGGAAPLLATRRVADNRKLKLHFRLLSSEKPFVIVLPMQDSQDPKTQGGAIDLSELLIKALKKDSNFFNIKKKKRISGNISNKSFSECE